MRVIGRWGNQSGGGWLLLQLKTAAIWLLLTAVPRPSVENELKQIKNHFRTRSEKKQGKATAPALYVCQTRFFAFARAKSECAMLSFCCSSGFVFRFSRYFAWRCLLTQQFALARLL